MQVGNVGYTYTCYANSWTTYPSKEQFKSNITMLSGSEGLDFIEALEPIRYTIDSDQEAHRRPRFGFTVEQVKSTVEALNWGYVPSLYDEESDHGGIEYSQFVVPLTKAVQQLSTRVKELEAQLEEVMRRLPK